MYENEGSRNADALTLTLGVTLKATHMGTRKVNGDELKIE